MEMAQQHNSKQLFGTVIILLGAAFMMISFFVLQQGISERAMGWEMISQLQLSEDNELRTWWPVAIIGLGVFLVLSPSSRNSNKKVIRSNQEKIKISNK